MFKGKGKNGKPYTLLNPAERGEKYANELRTGVKQTNDGKKKVDENGKPMRLTKEDRKFRIGYLNSRKDEANAWKSREAKKAAKKAVKKRGGK